VVELTDSEHVFFHGHPSWRAMLAFHIRGFVAAILAGVAVGLATSKSGVVQAAWVVAAVLVVFAAVLARGALRRARTTYTITSRRLTIETGLMARNVHETRIEHIQNVNCRQTPLERLLDVGTVSFDTAGGAAFEFSFSGIEEPHRIVRTIDHALHERALGTA
jgi:uncharacterized membrane protein YdbT with pleckstrin-like domain